MVAKSHVQSSNSTTGAPATTNNAAKVEKASISAAAAAAKTKEVKSKLDRSEHAATATTAAAAPLTSSLPAINAGSSDMELVNFIESAENSLMAIQKEMLDIDRIFHKKMRQLEAEKFLAKKSHFETRRNVIASNHGDFWQKMFLYNPEIEMHLNIDSKSQEVEECDLEIINSITSVVVEVCNSDEFFETKMTIHLDPAQNKYVENTEIFRLIKIPVDHLPQDIDFEAAAAAAAASDEQDMEKASGIVVETSELKVKPAYEELKKNVDKGVINLGLAPFIMQFVHTDYPIMNQFVETMKQVYANPIHSLKSGLEEETNYQMAMSSDDFEEDDEDENELSEVDEEDEEENESKSS